MPKNISNRFWKFVTKGEVSDCWLWIGSLDSGGYGKFWDSERLIGAHRFSYQLQFGPIAAGLDLLHACDTPRCVNPFHLRPGTAKDNMDDQRLRGRMPVGSKSKNAKLKESDVAEIRKLHGLKLCTYRQMANRFDVSVEAIRDVVTFRQWKHVPI